jgi:hypothetical protein
MSENSDYNRCILTSVCLIIFLGIITIPTVILPYFESDHLKKTTCFINNVTYPDRNPSFENYNNWEECDCGRRCKSYSPCINLFTNISKNKIINNYKSKYGQNICTFHDSTCKDGEDIRIISRYIGQSKMTYDQYMNSMVECYYDPKIDRVYININTSFVGMVICLAILGFLFLCCSALGCALFIDNNKSLKDIKQNSQV